MQPIHGLLLKVIGWSLLAAASFFFHVVAFLVVIVMFADQVQKFKFTYDNAVKGFPYDDDATSSVRDST